VHQGRLEQQAVEGQFYAKVEAAMDEGNASSTQADEGWQPEDEVEKAPAAPLLHICLDLIVDRPQDVFASTDLLELPQELWELLIRHVRDKNPPAGSKLGQDVHKRLRNCWGHCVKRGGHTLRHLELSRANMILHLAADDLQLIPSHCTSLTHLSILGISEVGFTLRIVFA